MNLPLVRRKYRILSLVAVAGIIYLCFQIFSLKVLNFSSKHDFKQPSKQNAKVLDELPESELVYLKDKPVVRGDKTPKDKTVDKQRNMSGFTKLVRGIHVTQAEEYKPDSKGNFQCLTSRVGFFFFFFLTYIFAQ